MTYVWQLRDVPIKFALGDQTLFAVTVPLQVCEVGLSDRALPTATPAPPTDNLAAGSQGFYIRSLPVTREQPALWRAGDYLCYVPLQYRRSYIDLNSTFASYAAKFSSKTRSTINRKLRKFAEHCAGTLVCKVYRHAEDVPDFVRLARLVSERTYQEKLLDAGLPASEQFLRDAETLAEEGRFRGYILFHGDTPVSYLYCPVRERVLIYQYLGYDPGYAQWSVGTILQWCALESVFEENCFRMFDFTEGESEHKRLFGTHSVQCANVIFLRFGLRNAALIRSHLAVSSLSTWPDR